MENIKKSLIEEKSFQFAISIVKLYKELKNQSEFVLSKQLLRSGTSIGANVSEALAAQSSKDFINKMSIASKEARETRYWLRLLQQSDLVKIDFPDIKWDEVPRETEVKETKNVYEEKIKEMQGSEVENWPILAKK